MMSFLVRRMNAETLTRGAASINQGTNRKSPSTFHSLCTTILVAVSEGGRDRYSEFITRIEDKTTRLMISPGLVDKLLFDSGTFEQTSPKT